MATTPGGLRYPIGTDKVTDGDNAIRALAEDVEKAFNAPMFQEFAAARGGVPTGTTDYFLALTPGAASVPPFAYTYTSADGGLTLPPGMYLYTAMVYIDWGNGGTGAQVNLKNPQGAGAASFIAGAPFGGAQITNISALLRPTVATKYVLQGFHNSGATRALAGTIRLLKFATLPGTAPVAPSTQPEFPDEGGPVGETLPELRSETGRE